MKYLITGGTGQVGYEVGRILFERGESDIYMPRVKVDSTPVGRTIPACMDITDRNQVFAYFACVRPNVLIHCAAYTAVDKAEQFPDVCSLINVEGTKNLVDACRIYGTRMIYVSTDYVFAGLGNEPQAMDTKTNPLNIYGQTKLAGEELVKTLPSYCIARTSWVYGINSPNGNFVNTMLNLSEKYSELKVVSDQVGSPTYAADLAGKLIEMADSEVNGVYAATNHGYCSWAEFAAYILKETETKVIPVSTQDYYQPKYDQANLTGEKLYIAKRPFNSRMTGSFGEDMREWTEAVDEYIKLRKRV